MLEKLIEDLRDEGTDFRPMSRCGTYRLTSLRGSSPAKPVELHASEGVLRELLRRNSKEAAEVYPEVPAETAAYRLLLTHVDAAIMSGTLLPDLLVIGVDGLDVIRPDEPPVEVEVSDDLRWSADRPPVPQLAG